MVQINGKAENQHYVPQFLLRGFSFKRKKKGSKKQEQYVFAYDKHTDKVFQPNISGIASERGFYDFYVGEENRSLEPLLSTLEDKTKTAIEKIIKNKSLATLTRGDRAWLSTFVAVQYLRVKKHREVIKDFSEQMKERVRNMGHDPDKVEGFHNLSDDEIKEMTMASFATSMPSYANLIANKLCLLFETTTSHPLYISDNPVVMHNDEDFGAYGNIGFGVPGIQIYLPLSSTLTLGFWCPSIQRKFQESWEEFDKKEQEIKTLLTMSPNVDRALMSQTLAFVEKEKAKKSNFEDNAVNGTPILIAPENVMFMNSHQVQWSHRFVMCQKDNFDLVRRMIGDNEAYREGIKLKIN